MSVHPSIHPSVCPHRGGGTPARSRQGWYLARSRQGGTPARSRWGGGYPTFHTPIRPGWGDTQWRGTPPQVSPIRPSRRSPMGGTTLGTPHQTWLGVPWLGDTPPRVPPSDLAGGLPQWGYPTLGTTPSDLAGGYPDGEGYPTE